MDRVNFYKKYLKKVIKDKNATILVVAGGPLDKKVFSESGYKNVTISNLDSRMDSNQYSPYKWSYQDAENLSFADCQFEFTVIHAGLHHCSSPHKALLEMYRVSQKGVLSFESKDSFLMRIGLKLKLTYQYELPAVFFNDMKYGGLNNSEIPNFVYRWTENEIEKVINTYAPYLKHRVTYFYGISIPKLKENFMIKKIFFLILKILLKFIPNHQGNLFGFFIEKPDSESKLLPWIIHENENLKLNKVWLKKNWMLKF